MKRSDQSINFEAVAMSGHNLSNAEAGDLERVLKVKPADLKSRAQLLGNYLLRRYQEQDIRRTRKKHALWFIENMRAHPFSGSPFRLL